MDDDLYLFKPMEVLGIVCPFGSLGGRGPNDERSSGVDGVATLSIASMMDGGLR